MPGRSQRGTSAVFVIIAGLLVSAAGSAVVATSQARRDFDIVARRYTFKVSGSEAAEIHVNQNDLVHVTLSTDDIPHSFTIDEAPYRLMKRAEPGKPVSFDFRADTAGRFRFYCNLTTEDRCKEMHGTLVVDPKR